MTTDTDPFALVNAMLRRAAPASPVHSPMIARSRRVIGSGERPLILLQHGNRGIRLDFVDSLDGETLRLASGASMRGHFLITDTVASVPRAMPYWSGPGIGLWEAIARMFSPETWDLINKEPGRALLTRECCQSLIARLFRAAAAGDLVIIARPLPIDAHAGFVQIDPSLHGFWDWDPITEQACPAPGSGAQPYGTVRIVTPDEWRGANNGPVLSPAAGVPDTIKQAGRRGPKPKVIPEVTSKMLTHLRDGSTTVEQLSIEKLAVLHSTYGASPSYCKQARQAAIAEFQSSLIQTLNNSKL